MSDPTPAQNARFIDAGGGTIAEMMSNQVQFFYDPTTGQANAIFNGKPYLSLGDKYVALDQNPDILQVDFSTKITHCYGQHVAPLVDPVTGADLTKVSVAGVMMLMKAAYDEEFNQRAAYIAAQLAAAEALAAVLNTINGAVVSPASNGTTCEISILATNGLTLSFQDASVPAEGSTITAWAWHFGSGPAISVAQSPTFTFPSAGQYDIWLAVTDSSGVTVRNSVTVTVSG